MSSMRKNIKNTLSSAKEEYGKLDLGDKILDLISIVGAILFIVAFISVFLSSKWNVINIIFIIYPLAVGGMAAALRMKKREKPEEAENLFKEWLFSMGGITFIALIIIILSVTLL